MTAVSITADNTRVDDAEALTGYTSIGGGSGASSEGSFPYQDANLINRKVTSSSGAGFGYTPTSDSGSALDATATGTRTMMAKFIVTDFGGLQAANGVRIRQGSSSSNYYVAVVAGTDSPLSALASYPARGGIVIVPVDLNIAAYRDSTTGTPDLSVLDWIGLVAAFSASTSKSENVGLDAIDFGVGLVLSGGDGADPDAVFKDFPDNDEGVVTNRYGYAYVIAEKVYGHFGTWKIGDSSATVMNDDSRETIISPDGMFQAGFSRIVVDPANALSILNFSNKTFNSLGTVTTEDTRAVFEVLSGGSGTGTITDNIISNYAQVIFRSGLTYERFSILNSEGVEQNGATLTDFLFDGSPVATGVAQVASDNLSLITDSTFTSGGSGHVAELDSNTPNTVNWDGNLSSGYSGTPGSNLVVSSGSLDADIYNNSGKAITIEVVNGATLPAIRNGAGATTTVVAGLNTLTVNGVVAGESEIRVRDGSVTLPGGHINPVVGTTFQMTFPDYAAVNKVTLSVTTPGFEYEVKKIDLFNIDVTENLILTPDSSWVEAA